MKKLSLRFLSGRDNRINGLIAFAVVMLIALGCTCGKNFDFGNLSTNTSTSNADNNVFGDDTGEEVDKNLINATVKATTARFANAISTEDFSNLYADTAQEFKNQYTEEQLKNEFKDFVRQKRQLLPILAKTVSQDPTYDAEPSTRTEAGETILTASGSYPTKPPTRFKYEYIKRGVTWKLLRLEIYIK